MPVRDLCCPACGRPVLRNHSCQARPPMPLPPEQRRANVAACREAIAAATKRTSEPTQLSLEDVS